MNQAAEKAIITEILDGQAEQFRLLVERYHVGLICYLANLLHDVDQAEDIAQEAFLQAYQKLSQYNPQYSFSTWLYRIATNLAFRSLKKSGKTVPLETEKEFADTKSPVPELLDREKTQQVVRSAVKKLDLNYQQVVMLYYWDDKSYEEIADILQRPIGTIRTWLHRAKAQLKKELYGQI